jgi:phosphomannomutase
LSLNVESFKAYDIRGRVPDQLNSEIAYAIGRAYAQFIKPERVVVGHDIRLSSPEITDALIEGLLDSGVDVSHIGTVGTEEIYFATSHFKFNGGIVVTASHNPKDYNGLKMVREQSRPISGDTGLSDIKAMVERNEFPPSTERGELTTLAHREAYIAKLLDYVDVETLAPLKLVANPGNGGAGLVMKELVEKLPVECVELFYEADGNFPNGVPNPLLPENRGVTIDAIAASGADLGIAWDGDFDRCFFFDENGRFIEGYYIVGLLAQAFLEESPGEGIVHDPRLVWNTTDVVGANKGKAILSKAGHAFIKEKMREEDAIYGGEMSAHHYFRDFAYCDSGMIPWLLVIGLMSRQQLKLSELVDERMKMYPVSGEINRRIDNAAEVIAALEAQFGPDALSVDHTDGLSVEFADWRFNVRSSNTEPVVRLNVESRADHELMVTKTQMLLELMGGEPG